MFAATHTRNLHWCICRGWEIETHVSVPRHLPPGEGRYHEFQFTTKRINFQTPPSLFCFNLPLLDFNLPFHNSNLPFHNFDLIRLSFPIISIYRLCFPIISIYQLSEVISVYRPIKISIYQGKLRTVN